MFCPFKPPRTAQRAVVHVGCMPLKTTPGGPPQAKIFQMFGFEQKKMYFRSYSHQILGVGIANGTTGGGVVSGIEGGGGYSKPKNRKGDGSIASDTKYRVIICLYYTQVEI